MKADFSPTYYKLIKAIDTFTEWTGTAVAWLIVPLTLAVFWEVFSRYVLNEPTLWVYDMSYMLYAALFMLGAHFALKRGAHIRTDMLWEKFSDRTKGLIDAVGYIVFFLPTMVVLFYISIDDFFYSMSINERSNTTSWQPVLWPLRGVIPIACLLLFVQGISELLKSLFAARTGQFLVHQEKLEL